MTAVERVERFANEDTGFCSHGLSDDVDANGSFIVNGKYAKIHRHFYYCHEHKRHGSLPPQRKRTQ